MSRFTVNSDNTVTDTQTGLTFTRLTLAVDVNHKTAEEKVAELGEGWRLASVTELFTLVDHAKHGPAIDTEAFPDIRNDWYWTSTPCAWNAAAVWVVGFGYGLVSGSRRSDGACVLAVRSSQ